MEESLKVRVAPLMKHRRVSHYSNVDRKGCKRYVLVFRSQSANRIDELYYKGIRLRRDAATRKGTKSGARGAQVRGGRLGDEVTSQTQAIQSIATKRALLRV